ncbi:GDP-mannose 4,6-dehydratase [Alphaproteobacteria bacterium]|nr:GDP-mannose 4,6-dehydratase [Alphaproteobacteria bacterium]
MKKKKKIALITGVTGQDGSIMTRFLLNKNYIVHGIKRRVSLFNTNRIDEIIKEKHIEKNDFYLHYGDITDPLNILNLINKIKPDEIYHFAAQSHVAISFEMPYYSSNVDSLGTLNILEAIKILKLKKVKFYNAASSEMYGDVDKKILDEKTPFNPISPYATSKLYSYYITKNYRNSYNIFASNGILFNHESENRGETFVTRKITRFVAKYNYTKKGILLLGNLDSVRDWGYANDYIEGIWKILQNNNADDFVLATGKCYSVKDFIKYAFKHIGIDIVFKGSGSNTIGYDKSNNKVLVKSIKYYYRPNDVTYLKGNPSKAKKILNWQPKHTLNDLVKIMLNNDLRIEKERLSTNS